MQELSPVVVALQETKLESDVQLNIKYIGKIGTTMEVECV